MTYLGQTLAQDPGRQPLQSFIKHLRCQEGMVALFTHEAGREAEHSSGSPLGTGTPRRARS